VFLAARRHAINFEELELSAFVTPPPPAPIADAFQPAFGAAPSGAPLASWFQRVGGYLIDYLLTVPGVVLVFIGMPSTTSTNINGNVSSSSSEGNTMLLLLGLLLMIGVGAANRWYLGGKGASLGKKALGLRLIGEQSGQPIGMVRAFLRDLVHILDSFMYIGYLFPLWDAKKQTFSDKILGTLVTKA
jgi:uncharacterized RDD family membrane protein YckC